jgi:hypothetical protein
LMVWVAPMEREKEVVVGRDVVVITAGKLRIWRAIWEATEPTPLDERRIESMS